VVHLDLVPQLQGAEVDKRTPSAYPLEWRWCSGAVDELAERVVRRPRSGAAGPVPYSSSCWSSPPDQTRRVRDQSHRLSDTPRPSGRARAGNPYTRPPLHGGRCRRVGRRRARPGRRWLARVRRQRVGGQRLRRWEGRRDRHRTSVSGGMEHDECAAPAGVGPDLPAARDQSTGSGDPFSRGDLASVALAAAGPRRVAPGGWLAASGRGAPSCRVLVPGSAGCRAQGRGDRPVVARFRGCLCVC